MAAGAATPPLCGYPSHLVAALQTWAAAPAAAQVCAGGGGPNSDAGFDGTLAAAAAALGPQADHAMRLLTLQALARLGGDRDAKRDGAPRNFDDNAFRLLGGSGG